MPRESAFHQRGNISTSGHQADFDSWTGLRHDHFDADFHDSIEYLPLRLAPIYRRDAASNGSNSITTQPEENMDKFFSWLKPGLKGLFHRSKSPTGRDQKSALTTEPVIFTSSSIASLPIESFSTRDRGIVSWVTLFSAPSTKTDSMTVGIATLPVKNGYLACHRHAQAEVYHILSGRGVLTVDGQKYAVQTGSVAFIPGDAEHGIENSDENEELKWFYCFAVDGFQDIVYRF